MSENRTHGYDLVYEFTDQLVRDLLPRELFPPQLGSHSTSVAGSDISFDYEVFFPDDPAIDRVTFDTNIDNGISVASAFSMEISNLAITPPIPGDVPERIAFDGEITVLQPVSVYTDDLSRRCLGMDFSTLTADRVDVEITSAETLPLPEDTVEQFLEQALHTHLRDNAGQLSFMCFTLTPDDNPLTIDDFDVRIIGDDCAAILVTSTDETTGDASAFSECHIPTSANSAFIISSRTLIMHVICPALLEALGRDEEVEDVFTYEDGRADLTEPVSLSDLVDHALVDSIMLQTAQIIVGENSMSLHAAINVTGYGYRASTDLVANVSFELHDNALVINYSYDVAEVDLYIYPWVWILVAFGAAVIPVVGGIVAIVLPILPFIIEPIAERIVDYLFGESGVETLPVPPMLVDSVILDDLQFSGRSVAPYRPPIPNPEVWLDEEVETGEWRAENSHTINIGRAGVMKTTWSASHEAHYRAETLRMTFPLTFDWEITLEGRLEATPLTGEGIVEIPDAMVEYRVDGRICHLTLDEGQSLDAVLAARVTSATGEIREASKAVSIGGKRSSSSKWGVELLEGPSSLAFLQNWESPADDTLDLPFDLGSYVDALRETSGQPARSALLTEHRGALFEGMGIDIPEEEFS